MSRLFHRHLVVPLHGLDVSLIQKGGGDYTSDGQYFGGGAIRIGVAGHRSLREEGLEAIRRGVMDAIALIKAEKRTRTKEGKQEVVILSSLAEGADRLVVEEALKPKEQRRGKWHLEAVLPFSDEEYVQDFNSPESRAEFYALLSLAISITVVGLVPTRDEAYERAGCYIVDHCDALIAIWDGRKAAGRGGTGDVVTYAQKVHRPLFWINADDGTLSVQKVRSVADRASHLISGKETVCVID